MGILVLAVIALVVSLLAGSLGYPDFAKRAAKISKVLGISFVVLFISVYIILAIMFTHGSN
jgi:uncharacterized membrane protein YtjA (UPF0391 family)